MEPLMQEIVNSWLHSQEVAWLNQPASCDDELEEPLDFSGATEGDR